MSEIAEIYKCRLCQHPSLKKRLDFGNVPLANTYKSIDEEPFKAPLEIVQCDGCGCVQLKHEVNPNRLFDNYDYESPEGLRKHFELYAEDVAKKAGLKQGDFVIEIGGNNGMLCQFFQKLGFRVLNIEPAKNIAEKSVLNGIPTLVEYFSCDLAEYVKVHYGSANLIISNNCLAHIPSLKDIFKGIHHLLEKDGLLVFENAYLLDTLNNVDIGQFYHEHIFYHSIAPLDIFLRRNNLNIIDVEHNEVQCGSFRCFVARTDGKSKSKGKAYDFIIAECEKKIYKYNDGFWKEFEDNIKILKKNCLSLLDKNKGKKIGIYGVPAKLALILQYFGIQDRFFAATEDSALKIGKFIPGTKIPILPKSEFMAAKPDIIFVGAYNFANRIMMNNKDFKGKWMIPIPNTVII